MLHDRCSAMTNLLYTQFNVWNHIELCTGIMAGSLPALKPLFASLLSSTKSLVANYGSHTTSHHRTADKSGFVRHEDEPSSQDVKLEDWKEVMHDSSAVKRPAARSNFRPPHNRSDSSYTLPVESQYSVRVKSGVPSRNSKEDDDWETLGTSMSNQSTERLHNPAEIHKAVQIYSTSQRAV